MPPNSSSGLFKNATGATQSHTSKGKTTEPSRRDSISGFGNAAHSSTKSNASTRGSSDESSKAEAKSYRKPNALTALPDQAGISSRREPGARSPSSSTERGTTSGAPNAGKESSGDGTPSTSTGGPNNQFSATHSLTMQHWMGGPQPWDGIKEYNGQWQRR